MLYLLHCEMTLSNLIQRSYKKNTLISTDEKTEAWGGQAFCINLLNQ